MGPVLREYFALLHDYPHWMFEITVEAITGILVYPFARWIWGRWQREHDRDVHGVHPASDAAARKRVRRRLDELSHPEHD